MRSKNRGFIVLFFLLLTIVITLGCNYPAAFNRFLNIPGTRAQYTLSAEYDATVVSEDGEAINLGLLYGMEWICQDVQGELYALSVGRIPEFKYKKAMIQWNFSYNEEEEWMWINYEKDIDRDYAVLGADGAIESWENDNWSGKKDLRGVRFVGPGVFMGELSLDVSYEDTFPEYSSWIRTETHHFFGLIPPGDLQLAYLCDHVGNPITQDLSNLTPDNFRQNCPIFYYECPLNK